MSCASASPPPYSRLEQQSTKVDKPATVLRWACKPVKHFYVLFGWGMKVFWTTEKGNLFRPMSWASACQPPHFQAGASKRQSGPTGGAEVGMQIWENPSSCQLHMQNIYIYTYTFVCIGDEDFFGGRKRVTWSCLCHAPLPLQPPIPGWSSNQRRWTSRRQYSGGHANL